MDQKPTATQFQGTIKFHARMERIFRSQGKAQDAESAKAAREALEADYRQQYPEAAAEFFIELSK